MIYCPIVNIICNNYLQFSILYNTGVGNKCSPSKKPNDQQPVLQPALPADGLRMLARMILRRCERERRQTVSGDKDGTSRTIIKDAKTPEKQEDCHG